MAFGCAAKRILSTPGAIRCHVFDVCAVSLPIVEKPRTYPHRLPSLPTGLWDPPGRRRDGSGLPDGVGVALAGKYLEQRPYRVWVLCGDSELGQPDQRTGAARSLEHGDAERGPAY